MTGIYNIFTNYTIFRFSLNLFPQICLIFNYSLSLLFSVDSDPYNTHTHTYTYLHSNRTHNSFSSRSPPRGQMLIRNETRAAAAISAGSIEHGCPDRATFKRSASRVATLSSSHQKRHFWITIIAHHACVLCAVPCWKSSDDTHRRAQEEGGGRGGGGGGVEDNDRTTRTTSVWKL